MVSTQSQPGQSSKAALLMRDRVVLITGASRGIGAATAKLLFRFDYSFGFMGDRPQLFQSLWLDLLP
jgi:NADP-dependent 3-hydroxy acid dehydrogenase YdfG